MRIAVAPKQRHRGGASRQKWKPNPQAGTHLWHGTKKVARTIIDTKHIVKINIYYHMSYNLYKIYMLCSMMLN